MQPPRRREPRRVGALLQQLLAPGLRQGVQARFQTSHASGRERRLHRALADRALVREAHPVGGEHAGEGVDEHGFHAQLVRHQAGVLAAGAAEALQGEARRVLALLDGDLLDGVRHVGHGHAQEAFRHVARRLRLPGGGRRPRAPGREALRHHVRRRAARSRPGPKIAGKCRGCTLPSMTLASVTVSGPPLR
jgi:hypothetical protein